MSQSFLSRSEETQGWRFNSLPLPPVTPLHPSLSAETCTPTPLSPPPDPRERERERKQEREREREREREKVSVREKEGDLKGKYMVWDIDMYRYVW